MRNLIALAVLAVLSGVSFACASTGVATREPDELRVLVLNIFAGKDAAGAPNLDRVAALVRASGADIALLQEVDVGTRRSGGVDQPAVLASLTGFDAAFGSTLDYQGGKYGIAILSRWPIMRDSMIPLPISPPQARAGGAYEPRGALLAVIETPAGPLVILNTHLDASGDDRYRLQELATLVRTAESQRGLGTPLLIGGDFNSRPDSEVIRRALASGWRDLWAECGGGREGNTYPAHAPVRRIDYLFVADAGTCSDARVLGEGISDHLGLLVTVRVARADDGV